MKFEELLAKLGEMTKKYTTPLPAEANQTKRSLHAKKLKLLSEHLKTNSNAVTQALTTFTDENLRQENSVEGEGDDEEVHSGGQKLKDIQAKKRSDAILGAKLQEITPTELLKCILTPYTGSTSTKEEDKAIVRLISGYIHLRGNGEWGELMTPYCEHRQDWHAICQVMKERPVEVDDIMDLVEWDMRLGMERPTEAINQYIDYVLRTMDVIKFAYIWIAHDSGEGSRIWKTRYHEELFRQSPEGAGMEAGLRALKIEKQRLELMQEGLVDVEMSIQALESRMKTARRKFSRTHDRTIAARKSIFHLYNEFGCAVLLDPFWDITGSGKYKVVGRSAAFSTLVDLVIEGLTEEEFQLVLIGVLKAVVGDEAVVNHVHEFVTKTKTKIKDYFEIEEGEDEDGEADGDI